MDYFHADGGGDHRVRTLSCAEQYRSMAFAQLTYRESLRDIETCLSPTHRNYHMGFRQPLRRSTLADACERKARLAYPCGVGRSGSSPERRGRCTSELGLDLTNTVYALDSTTIALCLSVFPWAHFRTTKAAVKMRSTCGATFRVLSTSRMASCTTFMPSICSCRKPEPSTSWIVATSTLPAFMCCTKPGPSSSRVPSRTSMPIIASIRRRRIARPASFATRTISLDGFYTRQDYPELLRRIRFKDPEWRRWSSSPTTSRFRLCALYKSRWQVNSSSSGSSSIFGSSSTRRRTR